MTTANLSVGINTAPAKTALTELREWLAKDLKVAVGIDPSSIDRSIQGYLKQRTFKIKVNTKAMANEVENDTGLALDKAFNKQRYLSWQQAEFKGVLNKSINDVFGQKERTLSWNVNAFEAELRGAVSRAFVAGAALAPTQLGAMRTASTSQIAAGAATLSPTAAALPTGQIQAAINQMMLPISEKLSLVATEMSKAAALMSGAARKAGTPRAPGNSDTSEEVGTKARAKRGTSAKDLDGSSISRSEPMNEAEAAAAIKRLSDLRKQSRLDEINDLGTYRSQRKRYYDEVSADDLNAIGYRRSLRRRAALEQKEDEQNELGLYRAERKRHHGQTSLDELNATGYRRSLRKRAAEEQKTDEQNELGTYRAERKRHYDQVALDELNATGYRRTLRKRAATEQTLDNLNQQGEYRSERKRHYDEVSLDELNATGYRRSLRKRAAVEQRADDLNDQGAYRAERKRHLDQVSQDEMNAIGYRRSLRRRAEQQEADIQNRMRNVFAGAKYAAADEFTPRGQQLAGAKALQSQFGPQRAAAFLNNDGLLADITNMESYRKKVADVVRHTDDAAAAHKKLKADLNDAHFAARGLASGFGEIWVTYGQILPLLAGFAIGTGIRAAVVEFAAVERQLNFVKALTENTTDSIKSMADQLHATSLALGASPQDTAKGLRNLTQAGMDVGQAMAALPDIYKLAVVGELSVADAALAATGILNAFGMGMSQTGIVADVLAKAGALSATSVSSMTESMKYGSVIAEQYGLNIQQVAVFLTAMGKRNIVGTSAGTAFKNMVVETYTPTSANAKYAMNDVLKVSAYDPVTKARRDIFAIVEDMRKALGGFNVQSQGAILRAIYGERGDKAFGSILNMSRDEIQKLYGTLTTESAGFTTNTFRALQQDTQGQFELLKSTILNTMAEIGKESAGPLRELMAQMRTAFGSEEVKSALRGLVQSVATIGTVAAYVLPPVVLLWGTFKAASLLAVGVRALGSGILTLGTAATGAATGAVGLMSLLGNLNVWVKLISVVATLGMGYLALREHKKTASEGVADELKTIGEVTKALEAENLQRQKKIDLLRSGTNSQGLESSLSLNETRNKLDDARGRYATAISGAESEKNGTQTFGSLHKRKKLEAEAAAALDEIAALKQGEQKLIRAKEKSRQLQIDEDRENQRIAKEQADKHKLLVGVGTGVFDPDAATRARSGMATDTAQARAIISKLDQEQKKVRDAIQLYSKLNEARYPSEMFGAGTAAEINATLNNDAESASIATQLKMLKELERERNDIASKVTTASRGKVKPEDDPGVISLDERIRKEYEELAIAQQKLSIEQQIAYFKGTYAKQKDNNDFERSLSGLREGDIKANKKTVSSYDTKALSPVDAAEATARLDVEQRYGTEIAKIETERVLLLEQQKMLKQQMAESDPLTLGTEIQGYLVANAKLSENIALQEARLAINKAQQQAAGDIASDIARTQQAKSETAEYGWDKFWNQYHSNAESSAKQVETIMKSSTDSMGSMFTKFVTTGKLDFKGFVASVAADAARMLANKAISQLLGLAVNFFAGGITTNGAGNLGSMSSSGGINGGFPVQGATMPGAGFATGGIMGPNGPLPMRQYLAGGVASTPQGAIFGEGRKREAYVPLNDGRSIPVTMQDGAGGGNVQVSVAVHIASDGTSKVESDTSGEKGRQLGEMVSNLVTEKLLTERRPGGLLYR